MEPRSPPTRKAREEGHPPREIQESPRLRYEHENHSQLDASGPHVVLSDYVVGNLIEFLDSKEGQNGISGEMRGK